jgi:hypothetical protein
MNSWKSNVKGDDTLIVYHNATIYKGNPKPEAIDTILRDLSHGVQRPELFSIPQSLLKKICLEEGKPYLEVYFGEASEEHLRITDPARRQAIFDFFRATIPRIKYEVEHYSKAKAGRKPLAAMFIISPLLLWSLYLAVEIENGARYEIIGDGKSIVTVVLAIAGLGSVNVMVLFGVLLLIAAVSFYVKTKNPKVVHTISIVR